ncbi:hypothetical protein GCM10007415_00900 [Parapedobacter pyrenivorans]|uniref:Neutral/alkaline non-lysosomal ceramidase, N-terminal n=2 Tax=Parapedobacter pyrenivorans TaxID=1305674 RepID=A0A917HBF8_9SPHI|nr:hypothetical protein GCM10007415_00900 [Parapedobacter pyrenivorans]
MENHMDRIVSLIVILLTPFLALAQPRKGEFKTESTFRAGAAVSNVTPFLGNEIVGNFNTPPATHIHDDLFVRCLVLDDGSVRLAFGVIDNVFVREEVLDAAKELVYEKTGIPTDNVMLSSTHTHSATSAGGKGAKRVAWDMGEQFDEYQVYLIRRIADGMVCAVNNLAPAQIAWGSVDIPEHVFNRRWKMKNLMTNPFGGRDQVLMNPGRSNPNLVEPAGPVDPELSFFAVQSLEGCPIALLANYSLHYVGGVPSGQVSADYFGVFAKKIDGLLNRAAGDLPFVGIMTNGTSGDINNIDVQSEAVRYEPYEKMSLVATDIAAKVFSVYQKLKFQDRVSLDSKSAMLTLGVRKPTQQMLDRARKFPELTKGERYHRNEHIYVERIIDMQENWPDSLTIDLQVFRIGGVAIGAIPFEVFAETGLELKEKSPFDATFIVGLANGGFGYLPTPKQHELGGYETWLGTNRVEIHASEKIVKTIVDMFGSLRD